jgi:hypothetical protein
LRLADWIRNEALLVEPVHGVPIKPFPRPGAVVQGQMEECEDGLIDFLGIDIHVRAGDVRSLDREGSPVLERLNVRIGFADRQSNRITAIRLPQ